jgi:hypothetical protein
MGIYNNDPVNNKFSYLTVKINSQNNEARYKSEVTSSNQKKKFIALHCKILQ